VQRNAAAEPDRARQVELALPLGDWDLLHRERSGDRASPESDGRQPALPYHGEHPGHVEGDLQRDLDGGDRPAVD
jgi:hypothetical protein